jgi:hypothetical protein
LNIKVHIFKEAQDPYKELSILIDTFKDGYLVNRKDFYSFSDEKNKIAYDQIKKNQVPPEFRKLGYKTNITHFNHDISYDEFLGKYNKDPNRKRLSPEEAPKYYSLANKNSKAGSDEPFDHDLAALFGGSLGIKAGYDASVREVQKVEKLADEHDDLIEGDSSKSAEDFVEYSHSLTDYPLDQLEGANEGNN